MIVNLVLRQQMHWVFLRSCILIYILCLPFSVPMGCMGIREYILLSFYSFDVCILHEIDLPSCGYSMICIASADCSLTILFHSF